MVSAEKRSKNIQLLVWIMVFACLTRCALVYINMQRHPSFFAPTPANLPGSAPSVDRPFMNPFGYEISNIAYSIVCKHEGFSSPFGGSTGPTGWVAPGIVMLYVISFLLFGCFTPGSILCMFALSILLSLCIIVLIHATAQRMLPGSSAGRIAALLYALCPQELMSLLYPHQTDFNVYTFWFILIAYLFLRMATSRTTRDACLFALAAGVGTLFLPVMVFPVAVCLGVYAAQNRNRFSALIRQVSVCTVIIAVVVAPYIGYQKYRTGRWFFVKSNARFEIALGNNPEFNGVLVYDLFQNHHPGSNKEEFAAYRSLGEIPYIQDRFNRFAANFKPKTFLILTAKRFLYFFFILKPYIAPERFQTWRLIAEYIGYAIPGLTLLLYLLLRHRTMNWQDYFIYAYIFSYSLPYLCAGIMYRYAYPTSTLTTILLAALLSTMGSATRANNAARPAPAV